MRAQPNPSPDRQRGFSLIELSIAILIGLFLVGGLLIIIQNNKRAFTGQNQLSQLQDSERLALSIVGDVIQRAGYYPDPTTNTDASTMPASGSFAAAQALTGTYSASAPGDSLSVRYATASGDGILNCSGTSNSSGGSLVYVNTFSVASGQLVCNMNGTNYTLVGGVTNLAVLYGVKTDTTVDNNTPDTYFNASQMTATYWPQVSTIRIVLTFTNPLYTGAANDPQPATINAQRVVNVMSRTGVRL